MGQQEILDKVGLGEHVSFSGIENVENTLFRNSLELASAVKVLTSVIQAVTSGITLAQHR